MTDRRTVLLWSEEPGPYVENLRRFTAGEPLRQVVDRALGY